MNFMYQKQSFSSFKKIAFIIMIVIVGRLEN